MVGTERSARSAVCRWSIFRSARAALSWLAVIMKIAASRSIGIEHIYTIQITVSSIILDAKYINAPFAPPATDGGARNLYRVFIEACRHIISKPGRVGD